MSRWSGPTAAALLILGLAACDGGGMDDQAKIEPYDVPPPQWGGIVGALPPVPGTVHQMEDGEATRPRITADLLARGGDRYAIFCAPCHGPGGHGDGGAVGRVVPQPPSLLSAPLQRVPDSHLFRVISNGKGRMYGYASRIPEADRWAIIAWLRDVQARTPDQSPAGTGTTPQG